MGCLILAAGLAPAADAPAAHATEVCRYTGTSSYSGRLVVETKATEANGERSVDATAQVTARMFGIVDWRYLYEEAGIWRGGELQSVGVNNRYSVAGKIVRQLWDVFDRTPEGMTGWRLQGGSLADFQRKHPGFVRHWDPETFGQPWRADYAQGAPERRADLDLPAGLLAPDLGTPLLLAFYAVRWAGAAPRTVPVFLPGFKRDMRADVRVTPVGTEPGGLLHSRSSVRHKQLSETEVSTGDAWVTPDHHLVRVTFDARGDQGSAQGELRLEGCQGTP